MNDVIQGYFPAGLLRITSALPVQRKAQPQAGRFPANGDAIALPQALMRFAPGRGEPLPGDVRQMMESLFGTSFAAVRIHVGPQAPLLGALAFTRGSDIHFAQGHYNAATPRGLQLLGHELTHVVQQRAGRVRNPFGSGVAVVHSSQLEAEADRMGQRAVAAWRVPRPRIVQRAGIGDESKRLRPPTRRSSAAEARTPTQPHGPRK